MSRTWFGIALASALLLGCGAGEPGGTIAAQDERFRLTWSAVSPTAADVPGELRLQVGTRPGWKLADEAPARLDLEPGPVLDFEPSALRREDARETERGFEFVTGLRASREGRSVARGELSFGVCEEGVLMCEVVHERIELPIEVAFAATGS